MKLILVVSSSKSLAFTALITVTYVSAIVLKILLSKWSDQINKSIMTTQIMQGNILGF
jgi:hypothetical protein